ncbi:MAG: hypothetical protein IJT32_00430 [Lachnospiraceae bacterium]|nr:hypothetical protein [Lachnospiraceae bacterium]
MGLSVTNLEPITSVKRVTQRPEAYAVSNEAEVSDAFSESMKTANAGRVNGPAPVVYPNAQVRTSEVGQIRRSQQVSDAYNKIASSFGGATTGYDANRAAASYSTVGSNIDVYA